MKPLSIALSGAGRVLEGGDLTNAQCKVFRIVTLNSPVQQIYPNESGEKMSLSPSPALILPPQKS
jgi:hypothetical protein